MKMRLAGWGWVGLIALTLAPQAANAGIPGVAGDYNVFALNNFVQRDTDSGGAVAAGGKFDPGGNYLTSTLDGSSAYTVGSGLNGGVTGLVVGGSANLRSVTDRGRQFIGGDAQVSGLSTQGDLTVFRNLTQSSGSNAGSILVGGNTTIHSPTVSGNVTSNGNLTLDNGGSVGGSIAYFGTYSTNNNYSPFNSAQHLASPVALPTFPIDFTQQANALNNLSAQLKGLADTGTVTNPMPGNGDLTVTGTHANYDSVHVSGAVMAGLAGTGVFRINGVAGETIIINIDGVADAMTNFAFVLNGVDRQHVLFNFYNATSLTLNSISVQGTILAPKADINFAGGNIDGTLIGKNIYGQGESHLYLFQGNVPLAAVPEPGTLAGAALGVLAAAWRLGRGRRRTTAV